MQVIEGSLSDVEDDRTVTRQLSAVTERNDEPAVRVWTPPRQIAFGRRDSTEDYYARARRIADDLGYEPVERAVGGNAVAYTGTTVAFAVSVPTDDGRGGIESRYERTKSTLLEALESTGASVTPGEPDGSFCPGSHSLQGDGKIAGIAQRVRQNSALIGGCVTVSEADGRAISDVLEPVYAALETPFDPESVGSLESAGGPKDPQRVVDAIERAFVGDAVPSRRPAVELLRGGGR